MQRESQADVRSAQALESVARSLELNTLLQGLSHVHDEAIKQAMLAQVSTLMQQATQATATNTSPESSSSQSDSSGHQ